jgi:hypothetical protein
MAFEIPGFNRSWVAGGTTGTAGSDMSLPVTLNSIALPSMQYLFVVYSNSQVLPVSASGAAYRNKAVGVLQNKPAPGQPSTIQISGVSRVHSNDDTIVPGTIVFCDEYGMAVSSAGANPSTYPVGIAESVAAADDGYMIGVLLIPMGALAGQHN